jgi:hypothetical protein
MLTDKYKADLKITRGHNPTWGGTAVRNAGCEMLRFLERRKDISSVLDFGSGMGTLGKFILANLSRPVEWVNYDPSVEGIDTMPERTFDCVASTDLLEHVEPAMLAATLTWMREHSDRSMFHYIDCNASNHVLPDGRSVHLIVQPPKWWRAELDEPGWTLMRYADVLQRKRSRERYSCLLIYDKT